MKKHCLKFICFTLLLCLIAPFLLVQNGMPVYAESVSIQDGVTLHCWNWSFKEIEDKMEIIASLGYTAIQTSPIQQAKQATAGYPSDDWWVFYQPAGFHIDNSGNSALGTKVEFQSMCKKAHELGIKVIVDVVANHMGNTANGTNGLASTIIQDLRGDTACWHDIHKNIGNYGSREEVTRYCMAGLPDLNTSNKKVQGFVLDFLKECIDAGADGFRFDAAKHIETPEDGSLASDFWPTVINGATDYAKTTRGIELYCYGELLDNLGGDLKVSAYTKYMSVTDNLWSASALSAVTSGSAGGFYTNYRRAAEASKLVLWAESHDTYADGTSRNVSEENVNKTWALLAARSGAMSLYLARPANMSQLLGPASNTGWAYPEVAAANKFHAAFIGESEYVANNGDIAYVERGNSGVVLVNCKGLETDVSVNAHNIADGTYTDQITGNTFTVSNGKISGTIGSTGIAVVMEGEVCPHTSHDAEGFCLQCLANVGHSYDADGNCPCGDVLIGQRTVYFVNTSKWSKVNFYSWYDAVNIVTNAWPGDAMTHVEDAIYSCQIPVNVPNIIFNDANGTQTEDLKVPDQSTGLNIYDYATGDWLVYEVESEEPNPDVPDNDEPQTPDLEKPQEQPEDDQNSGNIEDGAGEESTAPDNTILWIVLAVVLVLGAGAAILFVLKKK